MTQISDDASLRRTREARRTHRLRRGGLRARLRLRRLAGSRRRAAGAGRGDRALFHHPRLRRARRAAPFDARVDLLRGGPRRAVGIRRFRPRRAGRGPDLALRAANFRALMAVRRRRRRFHWRRGDRLLSRADAAQDRSLFLLGTAGRALSERRDACWRDRAGLRHVGADRPGRRTIGGRCARGTFGRRTRLFGGGRRLRRAADRRARRTARDDLDRRRGRRRRHRGPWVAGADVGPAGRASFLARSTPRATSPPGSRIGARSMRRAPAPG